MTGGRAMEGTAAISKSQKNERSWRGFQLGPWSTSIDVRDFIVRNATPYSGDEKFLVGPSKRTQAVWDKLQPYFRDEQKRASLLLTRKRHQPCWRTSSLPAISTAHAKTSLAFVPALTLGILCNALVCLGVWMCYGARSSADRIFTIVMPIAAFVAAGF